MLKINSQYFNYDILNKSRDKTLIQHNTSELCYIYIITIKKII